MQTGCIDFVKELGKQTAACPGSAPYFSCPMIVTCHTSGIGLPPSTYNAILSRSYMSPSVVLHDLILKVQVPGVSDQKIPDVHPGAQRIRF